MKAKLMMKRSLSEAYNFSRESFNKIFTPFILSVILFVISGAYVSPNTSIMIEIYRH